MIKVGLTGSIAVGKSFVSGVFANNGCAVLDADQVARSVVASGSEGLSMLVDEFGDGIITPNGELDRKGLGAIVFSDEARRQRLNAILHPLIIAKQREWLREIEDSGSYDVAVIDAALLIESGNYRNFDKVVVVWCERFLQLARLMSRDEITSEEAERRVAAQMPQEEKKSFADYLINTSGDFSDTEREALDVLAMIRADARVAG
ncbi:MAG: dephospho-CoA kinase [Pyrinomonadaceae bacterium]